MYKWLHPIDVSDQWDGFNDSGLAHFAGSPLESLAREVVQNSLDSWSGDESKPVRVVFEEISVKTTEIPGIEELRTNIQRCLNASRGESGEGEKAQQFFEIALNELGKHRIKVLAISDFNTKGIRGPASNGTPYFAFMKAKGQSKKDDQNASGSYGIGKFAPYAASMIRSVFVSTVSRDETGEVHQLTQGRAILMSHDDEDGGRHQGVGFWGNPEKCQPVVGVCESLPNWLQRVSGRSLSEDDCGTRLLVIGFAEKGDWKRRLQSTLIKNFFGAIHAEKLDLQIGDEILINRQTQYDIVEQEEILLGMETDEEGVRNTIAYLKCLLTHENIAIERHQNTVFGHCEIRVMVADDLPKKVVFLRNGMLISDTLKLNGLRRFSEFKDFVAIFQCKDDAGNALLRKMEPPRHDDFQPALLLTKDEQNKAKRGLQEAAEYIRDMLRRNAKDPVSEVTKLDELKEFFGDERSGNGGSVGEETNPMGKVTITARPIYKKSASKVKLEVLDPIEVGEETAEDGAGGGGSDGAGGGNTNGGAGNSPAGSKSGSTSSASLNQVRVVNPRAVVLDARTRKLYITSSHSGLIRVSLYEFGADAEYPIQIESSSVGKPVGGGIEMVVEKNSRVAADIKLKEDYEGAVKVVAHEV
jgi:hypothetical protein